MKNVLKALADSTRQKILDRLKVKSGQSLTELETALHGPTGLSRFGIMKHLKVLEDADLVLTRKQGRFKYHYLNVLPIQELVDRWIEPLLVSGHARATISLKQKMEGNQMSQSLKSEDLWKLDITKQKPDYVMSTFIRTTAKQLWDAITKGEYTAQYHFNGCRVSGKFEKGEEISHFDDDGNDLLGGTIIEAKPHSLIDQVFKPKWSEDMAPSRVIFEIEEMGDNCKFTILHYVIPEEQSAEMEMGWTRLTASMKSMLETGQALKFAA